jgi:CheY-like chemotaxis protein
MKTILIIENDKDNLFVLEYGVKDLGVRVMISEIILPLHEISKLSPALVLLDHWLAKQTGGDFCKTMKKNPITQAIPVLMISAHPCIEEIAKASGADDFLAKPFDLEDLRQKVQRHIL